MNIEFMKGKCELHRVFMMEFSIRPKVMNSEADKLYSLYKRIESSGKRIDKIQKKMEKEGSSFQNVVKQLAKISESIKQENTHIYSLQDALETCKSWYISAEEKIVGSGVDAAKIAKKAFIEGITELAGGMLQVPSMTWHMIKRDRVAVAEDAYRLINNVFTTGEDLFALTVVGISFLLPEGSKQYSLYTANDYAYREGFKDELASKSSKDGDFYDVASKWVTVVDIGFDLYDIGKGVNKLTHIEEYDFWESIGISSDGNLVNKGYNHLEMVFGHENNVASTTSSVVDYIEAVVSGDSLEESYENLGQEVLEKTPLGKTIKKSEEVIEEVAELFGFDLDFDLVEETGKSFVGIMENDR